MKIAKIPAHSPPHGLPLKLLGRSPAPVKNKSAPTTLVISIFHTSASGCAVRMRPLRAVLSHLPTAVGYSVGQSPLSNSISKKIKQPEIHERESWPEPLICISLPDSSGLSIRCEAGTCSLGSCGSPDPGFGSCQSRERLPRQPRASAGGELRTDRHAIK